MALTKDEIDLIISVLPDIGYEGYASGKYFLNGTKYTESKISAPIAPIIEAKCRTIFSEASMGIVTKGLKNNKEDLCRILKEFKLPTKVTYSDGQSESKELVIKDWQDIEMYRSLKRPPGYYGRGPYIVVVVNSTREILYGSEVDTSIIAEGLGIDLSVDKLPPALVGYNIRCLDLMYSGKALGNDVRVLNAYVPPTWRTSNVPPGDCPIPIKLIESVIPDKDERKYVYNWMYNLLVSRNNTVLVLHGDRGIGKTFIATLLSALVGRRHSAKLSKNILKGRFNAQMEAGQLGIFEEMGLSDDDGTALEVMKSLTNDTVSLEKKGEDAVTVDNTMSFIMCLNPSSKLGIGPGERRFSIPRLGTTPLGKVLDSKTLSEKSSEWSSSNPSDKTIAEIKGFYEFLKSQVDPDIDLNYPLRGDYFWEITHHALNKWQQSLIAFLEISIKEGEVFPTTKKFRSYHTKVSGSGSKISDSSVEEFIDNYYHRGRLKLGKFSPAEGRIEISEDFIKYILSGIPQEQLGEVMARFPKAEDIL